MTVHGCISMPCTICGAGRTPEVTEHNKFSTYPVRGLAEVIGGIDDKAEFPEHTPLYAPRFKNPPPLEPIGPILEANPLKAIKFKCPSCGSNPDVDCICKGAG